MKLKIALMTSILGLCAQAHADWFLRGTQNNWGTTQMVAGGTNTVQVTSVVFSSAGSIKFDRFGDWQENYGVGGRNGTNIPVAAGTWNIKFFTDTKNWNISPATASSSSVASSVAASSSSVAISSVKSSSSVSSSSVAQTPYHIRGTFNAWAEGTLMARVGTSNVYESCINFTGGDANGSPRFKVDPNGGWGDAIPANDYVVSQGWVKVSFNSTSKDISVQQNLPANCAVASSSTSSAISSSASSQSSTPAHTFNKLNLRQDSNSWAAEPMALVADHIWQGQTHTLRSAANQFKFDVNGDWSLNFGDNTPTDGIADQNGANILVNGCYNFDCTSVRVLFNDNTREYALCYDSEHHNDSGTTSLCAQ
ncbi:MAG TPA: hypothetical protein VN030_14145 [Cellvibrio sp.]|nr:hypothetical protein [Cellvibrio sp.]